MVYFEDTFSDLSKWAWSSGSEAPTVSGGVLSIHQSYDLGQYGLIPKESLGWCASFEIKYKDIGLGYVKAGNGVSSFTYLDYISNKSGSSSSSSYNEIISYGNSPTIVEEDTWIKVRVAYNVLGPLVQYGSNSVSQSCSIDGVILENNVIQPCSIFLNNTFVDANRGQIDLGYGPLGFYVSGASASGSMQIRNLKGYYDTTVAEGVSFVINSPKIAKNGTYHTPKRTWVAKSYNLTNNYDLTYSSNAANIIPVLGKSAGVEYRLDRDVIQVGVTNTTIMTGTIENVSTGSNCNISFNSYILGDMSATIELDRSQQCDYDFSFKLIQTYQDWFLGYNNLLNIIYNTSIIIETWKKGSNKTECYTQSPLAGRNGNQYPFGMRLVLLRLAISNNNEWLFKFANIKTTSNSTGLVWSLGNLHVASNGKFLK